MTEDLKSEDPITESWIITLMHEAKSKKRVTIYERDSINEGQFWKHIRTAAPYMKKRKRESNEK